MVRKTRKDGRREGGKIDVSGLWAILGMLECVWNVGIGR